MHHGLLVSCSYCLASTLGELPSFMNLINAMDFGDASLGDYWRFGRIVWKDFSSVAMLNFTTVQIGQTNLVCERVDISILLLNLCRASMGSTMDGCRSQGDVPYAEAVSHIFKNRHISAHRGFG